MITITSEARQAIAMHAQSTYPDECVGLLLGTVEGAHKRVTTVYQVENRWAGQVVLSATDDANSRRDRFYLDPRDYLKADRAAREQGLDVVGCYHSHPDHPAIPSERDRVGAQGVGGGSRFSFVIQSVRAGHAVEIASWLLAEGGERFVAEEIMETKDERRRMKDEG